MSLSRNIAANYIGQIYLTVIGLVMVPVYVSYLGAEAYGLVGFFTMLQAWFLLLDLGLTPTLARELVRFRAGALERMRVIAMVRALEYLLGGLGAACALGLGWTAGWIAREWLQAQQLPADELRWSVVCMGTIIGLRGLIGLYRSGLTGLERIVALNAASVVLATLRAVGALAVLMFWTTRPSAFFAYQVILTALELGVMGWLFYRSFPMRDAGLVPSWRSLQGILRLSGSMAFLAGIWVVFSQADKLVLSWVLDLKDYGFFIVATTLASAISLLAAPISQALQPRFSLLAAQQRHDELVVLYRTSTQFTGAVVFAFAGVLTCFAEPLLKAWTGSAEIAREAARLLPLYALGNAVVALLSLAFLVQFAYGKIRWQVIGNCAFGVVWIPGAYLAASRAGAVGTGWIWLIGNLVFLLFWLPYVHHRLLPGIWARWLFHDVGVVLLTITVGLAAATQLDLTGASRLEVFGVVALTALFLVLAGLCAGSATRRLWLERFRRFALVKDS